MSHKNLRHALILHY